MPDGAAAAPGAHAQAILLDALPAQIIRCPHPPVSAAAPERGVAGAGCGPHEDPAPLHPLPGRPQRAPWSSQLPLPAVRRQPRSGPLQAPELGHFLQQRCDRPSLGDHAFSVNSSARALPPRVDPTATAGSCPNDAAHRRAA